MEGASPAQDSADPDPQRTQHLEELLFACLEARAQGDSARLAQLLPTDPAQAASLQRLLGIADGLGQAQPLPKLGEYELLQELGGGGMGVVHLARQPRLHRLVAIKLIRPEMLGSAKMRERFHREARALARVSHPGICPVYDFGETDGQPYLVMQYLPGKRLAEMPLPQNRAELDALLQRWEQVCEAVQTAHEAGLVHRDLKPQNVVLAGDGRPVVLDFGLARILDDGQPDQGLTTQNQPLGTPAYMAPERLTGAANAAGPGVDVYSLGVSLFQGITGELPFQSPVLEALWSQILRGEPRTQRLRQRWMPAELAVVVATSMERDPARRYQSAAGLAEDLRRVREGLPILARRPSVTMRVLRWTQRNRTVAALLVGMAVALSVTIVVVRRLLEEQRYNRSQALAGEAARHHAENPALQAQFALAAIDQLDLAPARNELAQGLADWQLQARLVAREARSNMAVALPNGGMAAVVDEREVVVSRALGGRLRFARPDSGPIESLAIAPDESQMVLGGGDGKLCFVELATGTATMLPVGEDAITVLQYSPDGAWLAIATDRFEGRGVRTGRILLWERGATAVRPVEQFTGPGLLVLQFAFPRDRTQLLSVVQGKFVVAHRLADGEVLRRITNDVGAKDPIVQIQLLRDEMAIACGGRDGSVFEVALSDGVRTEIGSHAGRVAKFALSPDGRTLASMGNDRTVKLWDLRLATALQPPVVLRHPVLITNVAFHPDGRLLVTGANDMAVRFWTLAGDNVLELPSGIGATNLLSVEGDRVWLGSEWNGSGCYELLAHGERLLLGHTAVSALRPSPHTGGLWTGGSDGSLQAWSGGARTDLGRRGEDPIVAIDESPDGNLLLALEEEMAAHVHDRTTGSWQALHPGMGFVRAGWILDGGSTVCVQTGGPAVEANALTTYRRSAPGAPFEPLAPARRLPPGLGAGTLDASHRRLLLPRPLVGDRGGFLVVDLEASSAPREIAGEPCSRVVCSLVGGLHATCMTSHVRLWRGLDDAAPTVLHTDSSGTNDLAFSPDGRYLAAISKSGAVWLFATVDGGLVWRGVVPAIGWSVAFSLDGRHLLTGDSDGVVRHWLVEPEAQRDLARERLCTWSWDDEERRILTGNGVAPVVSGAR